MSIAQKIWDYRLKEMMVFLNLNHDGTVGNAISMIANELNEDSELHLKINAIIKRLDPNKMLKSAGFKPITTLNAFDQSSPPSNQDESIIYECKK